jgi:hypothetical protein
MVELHTIFSRSFEHGNRHGPTGIAFGIDRNNLLGLFPPDLLAFREDPPYFITSVQQQPTYLLS